MSARRGRRPEPETPLDAYREALRVADADSVHDLIARRGIEVLTRGLPWLVMRARFQRRDDRRKDGRHESLLARHSREQAPHDRASIWDPYEQLARNDSLRSLLDILARLPERDLLAVWRHMEGRSDEEILAQWKDLGLAGPEASSEDVGLRRRAAIARLRRSLTREGTVPTPEAPDRTFETGEACPSSGAYLFSGYADGSLVPAPGSDEVVITLREGERFPAIASSRKAACWRPG